MDDLISRQAAIDGLDVHCIERINLNDWQAGWNAALDWVKDAYLDELPSAQPDLSEYSDKLWRNAYERGKRDAKSEIVRCKDCKHQEKFFHEDKRRKEGGYYIFGCELDDEYSHVCLDEDFCNYAERRTDGN